MNKVCPWPIIVDPFPFIIAPLYNDIVSGNSNILLGSVEFPVVLIYNGKSDNNVLFPSVSNGFKPTGLTYALLFKNVLLDTWVVPSKRESLTAPYASAELLMK